MTNKTRWIIIIIASFCLISLVVGGFFLVSRLKNENKLSSPKIDESDFDREKYTSKVVVYLETKDKQPFTESDIAALDTLLTTKLSDCGYQEIKLAEINDRSRLRLTYFHYNDTDKTEVETNVSKCLVNNKLLFCSGYTNENVLMDGNQYIKTATPEFNSEIEQWVVNITLTEDGARKFSEITSRLIGQQLSVWLGDECLLSAGVQCIIDNGEFYVTINSAEKCKDISAMLTSHGPDSEIVLVTDSIKIYK